MACGLEEFPPVDLLTGLEELELAGNYIPELPAEIGQLTKLTRLSVIAVSYTHLDVYKRQGDYSRAVTIRQKGFSDFLRVFDDTIVLGSHYNVMELEARTTVHWEYELQGDHSWLDNWRERRNPASTYELGTRSRLLADVETNRAATSRECDVIFKYAVDGKSMQQKVKVIQLGYNLSLIHI